MLRGDPPKPPKRKSAQKWAEEQLAAGNLYAFDYTPEQLAEFKKVGKAPEFYNPKLFKKGGNGFNSFDAITDTSGTDPFIKFKAAPIESATAIHKPGIVEGRKSLEFGPNQTFDPNTGKYFDPISGQEIKPIIEQKKNGGLVGKYSFGGAIPDMGVKTQGAVSGLAGPASALGTTAATAIDAGNMPNEQGEINQGKAALAGGLKMASTVAPLAANPALLAATGGLSALAIPIAGGVGAVVSAVKAKKQNEEAVKQFEIDKNAAQQSSDQLRAEDALRKRDIGMSKGGKVVGKGTGTSDGVAAKVRAGSFIVPAKNAEVAKDIKEKVLRKAPGKKAALNQGGGVDVKLSNGEYVFTPEEVNELASNGIDINALAPEAKNKLTEYLKCGGKVNMYKDGGEIPDNVKKRYGAAEANKKSLGGQKSAPKRTAAKPKEDIEPITDLPDLSLRELEGVGKKSYNELMAESTPAYTSPTYTSSLAARTTEAPVATTTTAPPSQGGNSGVNSGGQFDWQGGLNQVLGYGIPAVQTAIGASALSKLGKRPIDKLDPEYLATISAAKDRAALAEKEAMYGFTPEEKFLMGQQSQGLLNQASFASQNLSGGSGVAGYNMLTKAIGDKYNRGLMTQVQDRALKLQKQGIAADRAQYADALVRDKTDMNRRLFSDTMRNWQENQQAAGALTQQGLTNLVSQNRYNQFLQNRESYQ
jgi:hypothetical protein